jgi:hypothetical protein
VVEVITIGGGLPDFLEASRSGRVFSVPIVSVSMSLLLKGAENLRVGAALVGSLPAADFGTDIVYLLATSQSQSHVATDGRSISKSW